MVKHWNSTRGSITLELMAALGILVASFLPLAYSFVRDQQACRVYYWRAAAMAIVDGEMEALVAGEWRAFTDGVHEYPVKLDAARNLPAGRFLLTVSERQLRLEWKPDQTGRGSPVVREAVGQ